MEATDVEALDFHGGISEGEITQFLISLTGKIAHFELGYISEQAVELKTAAGLLISGFTRQHTSPCRDISGSGSSSRRQSGSSTQLAGSPT
jgi:hypothetical protein